MRIVGGVWKGRRLKTLPGLETRPTGAKVKEALFQILSGRLADCAILDLFSGSGSLAWEALSRGAARAVLVEKNHQAAEVLRQNKALLQTKAALIREMDAFHYLGRQQEEFFDIIFLDPPYGQGLTSKALECLKYSSYLAARGVIAAETNTDEDLGDIAPFKVRIEKRYGDTKLWFIQRADEEG